MPEAEPPAVAPRRQAQVHATVLVLACALTLGAFVFARVQPPTGLSFTVFDRTTWDGRVLLRGVDTTLSFELIGERPFIDWQTYSVEWRGRVDVPSDGAWTFALVADDVAVLEVDDRVVVDTRGGPASRRTVGTVDLSAGLHEIRLRYVQDGGRHDLDMRWSRDGELFASVPPTRLLPPGVSDTAWRWRWLWPGAVALLVAVVTWFAARPLHVALARLLARPRVQMVLESLTRPGAAIALLLAVGLPLRATLLATSPAVLWPDSTVFHLTSADILRGLWASHDAYRTAVYPFVLAAIVGGRDSAPLGLVLVALQQLAGLGATAVFYLVGRRVCSPRAALAGALVFALHPLQLFYEMSVLTEATFTLGLAVTLWAAMWLYERPGAVAGASLGALAALLVLIRPVAQWYLPALLAVIVACYPRRKMVMRAAAVALLCYAVPMLGWMAVNQAEFGFFGVALGRGMGLYTRVFEIDGLLPPSPGADPEMRALWARATVERWSPNRVRDELNYRRRLNAAAADERLYAFAKETAFAHLPGFGVRTVLQWSRLMVAPRDSIRHCPSAVGDYLCSGRSTGESLPSFPNAPSGASRPRDAVVAYVSHVRWPMVPIALLALAGAVAALAGGATLAPGALVLVTVVCMTAVPAVSQYPHDRFRLPVDALLFVLAAGGLRRAAVMLVPARAQ